MKTRTLTGTVEDLTGQPYRGLNIPIKLIPMGLSAGQLVNVPQGTTTVVTDHWGQFSADLWVGNWSLTPYSYTLRLPGEEVPFFFLPGAPIDLAEIRAMQATEIDPKVMAAMLAQVISDPKAQAGTMPASDMYTQLMLRFQADLQAVIADAVKDQAGDLHYEHLDNKDFASDTWVVKHGLGKYPSVQCKDEMGKEFDGTVTHNSKKQLTIRFDGPRTGTADCN